MKDKARIFDLVCGMDLSPFTDLSSVTAGGKKILFCGEGCKRRYEEHPQKFEGVPLVQLEDVRKAFRTGPTETRVLRGLNLRIWEGDFTAIIGASGSGKSTLLNMIGLLDRPTAGKIFLKGHDVSRKRDDERAFLRSQTFGFVFQQYHLIPWLTAYENVALPLVFAGKDASDGVLRRRFEEIGLGERMTHRPAELSGGEQQRTAILRALANDPTVILGDEPTGNLDSATGNKILDMLIHLNRKEKKTLVIVTHDADIASKADEVIVLKDGEMLRHQEIHKRAYTE